MKESQRPESRLSDEYTLVATRCIFPKPPVHFDGTFWKQSHFPNRLDHWKPGLFHQTIRINGALIGVRCRNLEQGSIPLIEVALYHSAELPDAVVEQVLEELRFRYDLGADLTEFAGLAESVQRFADVFRRWKGMRASSQYSLYELLVVGLVLQNTQIRRSVQMLEVLTKQIGSTVKFDDIELDCIWSPEEIDGLTEEELRALKIGYRARSLKRFSLQFTGNSFEESFLRALDDESLRRELLKIYSVGPETARIIMSEGFHRPSAFTHVAPWQQKIYSRLFYCGEPVSASRIVDDINREFGKYSALAVHYIWEDIFWRRRNERIDWLEAEIRL